MPATVSLVIDGRTVTAPRGTTVYQAARGAGVEIPIFCYHDRMPPLGACRMCLVRVEKMPKLQTSCTLVATDGMIVDTTSGAVKAGQEAILEFLLINHPLDCPICDKGGECPLQDQAFAYGPGRSRFVEVKRDFAKPVSLGPVLALDRERCILCWRCVRFGEIVAGDDALKGFERGFTSEVSTPFTLPVESKFIGNTIAICPVGALTSKTYRFRARPWDNAPVASTCTHCGVGCAVWLDERDGQILRTRAREDRAVNDIWLCDRGFFGHDYVGSPDRLTTPLVRRGDRLEPAGWDEALAVVADALRATQQRGPGRVAFLGGRRLSNEDAVLAAGFFRQVAGTPHLDHRVDAPPASASLDVAWGLRASIEELARGDVFVLVGCDLTEEYPLLWLRIKPAIDAGARLVIVDARSQEIRRYAAHEVLRRVDRLPATMFELRGAVSEAVDARRTAGAGRGPLDVAAAGAPTGSALAGVGAAIASGQRVHVLVGRLVLDAPGGRALLRAAEHLARLTGGALHVMRGAGNDFGAQRFGLRPADGGWSAPEILEHAAAGDIDVLYVAGADPATAVPDRRAWEAARRGVGLLVVHEAFLSATAQVADVVLPALVLPEKHGTVTNVEGRTLPLRAAAPGPGAAREDREIFGLLAARLGATLTYGTPEELLEEMRVAAPDLAVGAVTPLPPVRAAGGGVVTYLSDLDTPGRGDARGLVLVLADRLFTHGTMTGRCAGIAALAGTPHCLVHPDDAARLGVADGALVRLQTAHDAVVLQARVSAVTLPGQVIVPRGFDRVPAHTLVAWPDGIAEVEVRPVEPAGVAR
jgi:NADH-quinone oxidoreductase subunit G